MGRPSLNKPWSSRRMLARTYVDQTFEWGGVEGGEGAAAGLARDETSLTMHRQWEEVGAEDTGWNSFEQLGGWKEGKLQSAANGLSHSAGST